MLTVVFLCSFKGDSEEMGVRFNAFFVLCWLTELFPNNNVYAEFWSFSFLGNGTGIVFSSANTSAEEKKQ